MPLPAISRRISLRRRCSGSFPLSLYLLTFILVFARHPPLPHWWMIKLQPLIIIPVVVLSLVTHNIRLLGLHLAGFFVIAMFCHGELAARRPPVENLTEFYLYISLGGVLGGLFNALVAPVIFPDIWEYPVMIAASCLLRPAATGGGAGSVWRDILLPGLLLVLLLACAGRRAHLHRTSAAAFQRAALAFCSGSCRVSAGGAARHLAGNAQDHAQLLWRLSRTLSR